MVGNETKIAVNETNIKNLHAKIEDLTSLCKEILTQVKYTNGRVSKLEMWKSYTMGAVAVMTAILAMFGIKIF